jgi:hypothetical protein
MRTIKPIATILLLLTLAATASARVTVKREPVDVQYKTFDPANPPAEMPRLNPREVAVTISTFRIQAAVDYELADRKPNPGGWTSTVDVHGLTITLQLHVVIYTPQGVSDKLKAHEEGHRKIAEQIYQERAIPAARAAGALLDGKHLSGDGPDWKTAAANAVNPLVAEMGRIYLQRTTDVSDEVNNDYDDLTAHGVNDKPEAEAIKQAFDRYILDHPTTRPAK